jgi:hypothetical protein
MRKISAYSILLLGVLVLFSMSTPVNDMQIITAKKFSKSIEKNFPISAKGEVVIINQYGNLDINTWNKNEVQFKVEIVVNATSESVAEDVFEAISVEFEGNKSLVRAETVIEEKNDYWWNWGKNIKSDFEINYEVYMPNTCSVDFDNKYGNINMMDLANDAVITVKYGDLTMGDLDGDLQLDLGYGNAFIGAVEDVQAEIKYSKVRCDYAKDFVGETKYSGLNLNSANKVSVDSKYDNYTLGEIGSFINEGKYDNFIIDKVGSILIETKYTDLKVGQLDRSLSAELGYGGINVKNLSKGFDEISIESEYAGIQFGVEKAAKFDLELSSKYVDVNLSEQMDTQVEEDGSEKYIRASYNGGGQSKIYLEMNYGFLKIK